MNENPFSRLAVETVPYARRRKIDALADVPKTEHEKKRVEQDKLWEKYLLELEERRKVLVSGPYAGTAEALIAFLKVLTFDDGEKLIEMAMVWQGAPRTTRFLVLQIIDEAMINLRTMNGLAPFDDPMFDEPPNAFLTIRSLLT
jgi:hypothetical protein